LCKLPAEKHMKQETCPLCYLPTFDKWIVRGICDQPNCSACHQCVANNIINQFSQRVESFHCICSHLNHVKEERVKEFLGEENYIKLLRYRLARQVDSDPNMIWCPSAKCGGAIRRQGGERRIVCVKCGTNACFRC